MSEAIPAADATAAAAQSRTALGHGLSFPAASRAQGVTGNVDLSRYPIGPVPPDFLTSWRTGQGAAGDWQIVEDRSATQGKAIAQLSAHPTDYHFPLAVYKPLAAQDVEARVRFKAVAGKVDRAGGLAVRQTDADNYYVVRANAREDNVNLYRVVKGSRQQIAGVSVRVSSDSGTRSFCMRKADASRSPSMASRCPPRPTGPSPASARSRCGPKRTA